MAEAINISKREDSLKKRQFWNKSIFVGTLPQAKSVLLDTKCDLKKWTTFKSLNTELLHIPENKFADKRGCVNLKRKAGLNYQNFLNNKIFGCKGRNSIKCNSNYKFYPSFECEGYDGKINKEKYMCSRKQKLNSLCQPPTSFARNETSFKDLAKFDIDSKFLKTDKINSRSESVDYAKTSRITSIKATFDNFDLSESVAPTKSKENLIDFGDFTSFCLRQNFFKEKLLHECGLNGNKNFVGHDKTDTSLDQKAPDHLKTEQINSFFPNMKPTDILQKYDNSNFLTCKGSIWLQSFSWCKESNLKQDALSEEGNDYRRQDIQLGGFAEKAHKLVKHEKSTLVLWHHNKHLKISEDSSCPEKYSTFMIQSYFHFHHLVAMSCTILENSKSDNQNQPWEMKSNFEQADINKNCGVNIFGQDTQLHHIWKNNFDSEAYPVEKHTNRIDCLVIVKLKLFHRLKLKSGSCVIIYPPWQTLFIKSLCVPVLLCTHFVDVLHQIP